METKILSIDDLIDLYRLGYNSNSASHGLVISTCPDNDGYHIVYGRGVITHEDWIKWQDLKVKPFGFYNKDILTTEKV